jgi:hypothetical protein
MSYILEFNQNGYTVNSHISIHTIKDMCESNGEVLIPLCPKCHTTVICDDQKTDNDHIGWCVECNQDYYECEIKHYEVI